MSLNPKDDHDTHSDDESNTSYHHELDELEGGCISDEDKDGTVTDDEAQVAVLGDIGDIGDQEDEKSKHIQLLGDADDDIEGVYDDDDMEESEDGYVIEVVKRPKEVIGTEVTQGTAFMTKFEKAALIGIRAGMIDDGAESTVSTKNLYRSTEIAEKELQEGVLPLMISRKYPDGRVVTIRSNVLVDVQPTI